jgi:hypothetical protein
VGPDLHHGVRWSQKAEQLKRENHPFQEKLIRADAANDHHPIAAVAVATGELRQGKACRKGPLSSHPEAAELVAVETV